MSVYIVNSLQTSKMWMKMISPKYSITTTVEGNAIDMISVGELEIHTVLTCHCALIMHGLSHCLLFGPYCKNF